MKSVICNWKMNPESFEKAKKLFNATNKIALKYKKAEIVVAPPCIFLHTLSKSFIGTRIEFSAQNIYFEQSGSYTGEVSAIQVKNSGATYAIIGHAERRSLGETDEDVNKKVLSALASKLDPIVAVGEHERDSQGNYIANLRIQITTALKDVPVSRFKNIIIAYEPIWAIGASEAPNAHEVHQMILLVRKTISDTFGEKAMKLTRVVYGGSVNNKNAKGILEVPGLSGVLVGRVSLNPEDLEKVIKVAANS